MPLPENCIDLIGPSRVKRNYDPELLKILRSDKIPSLVQALIKPTRVIVLYNPEKEEKMVRQAIEMLEKEIDIQYSHFDKSKYEELFPEITFGRGILNLLLRTSFTFSANYDPQAERTRKLLWSISNIESYGFVNPFKQVKGSDTIQRDHILNHIIHNCKDLLPPDFSKLSEIEITEKFLKYLNHPECMLNGYSHFGKLRKIGSSESKELVEYYNFQAIETVICNSSNLILLISDLSGADFKSLFQKLRFSRANYEIYSRPWESNHVLLIFNRGYRLFNANDITSKYLSRILLNHLIPSLISKQKPFILMNLMKSRGKDVIVHLLPEDFIHVKVPDSIISMLKSRSRDIESEILNVDEDYEDVQEESKENQLNIEEENEDFDPENEECDLDNGKINREFDSQIEAEFNKEFQICMGSLWTLEREPEIITTKSGKVMIPDFTFSNGSIKIYLEIVGFWTSKYIKNKLLKISELNREEIPPFFFLIDEDLKKYFKELTLQNKNIHFLYYKPGKLNKSLINLKDIVMKHYSATSINKEKIESILFSDSIWNFIENMLEKVPIIGEDQLFNTLKIMVCDQLNSKGCITPDQIPNAEIERIIGSSMFKQQVLETRSFDIYKSIGVISKANFRQIEKIIMELIGTDEISDEALHLRFNKAVPNSPLEPMKVVNNSTKFKIRWSGLTAKMISVKNNSKY